MNRIDPEDVAKRYNALDIIIDADDLWHLETKKRISDFIKECAQKYPSFMQGKTLNAGSAGYSYGLSEDNILHIDVAEKHLKDRPNSIIGDIQNIPLEKDQIQSVICVGSVLNYCDPFKVINEFHRIMSSGGFLILEFECSKTYELLLKRGYNKNAFFVETIFDAHGDKEQIWYFSEGFIHSLLTSFGYEIIAIKRFHLLSPLFLRLTGKSNLSARFIKLDGLLSKIPILNKICSNVILLCRKKN